MKEAESEFVATNAQEALNFHISVLIYCLCCIPLVFILIGIPMLIIIGLASLFLAIIAAVKVSNGLRYACPAPVISLGLINRKPRGGSAPNDDGDDDQEFNQSEPGFWSFSRGVISMNCGVKRGCQIASDTRAAKPKIN